MTANNRALVACVALLVSALACSDTHPRNEEGGETHFLTCVRDSQCEGLGADFECIEGLCMQPAPTTPEDAAVDEAAIDADVGTGCTDGDCGAAVAPLVMLLVDTSGSMERQAECPCTTASCSECLPDCTSQTPDKNRWTQTLEALTGTFDDFSCEARQRVAPEFTYDVDYVFPYFKPSGTQRDDGVLQAFEDRLRFGVATLEGIATYGRDTQLQEFEFDDGRSEGIDGLWSYGGKKQYRYPFTEHTYWMDTGIRNRDAGEGKLIVGIEPGSASSTVAAIHETLLATRPYGSTPIAAALDDVRALFADDPTLLDERRNLGRVRHLVLITDGRPDDDYRQVGCDCFEDGNADDCGGPPNVPSEMTCPYPLPQFAARVLRCGDLESCDGGSFQGVHVVGLAVAGDREAVATLNAIARAGGDSEARLAGSRDELSATLRDLFEEIANRVPNDGGLPDPIEPLEPPTTKKTCTIGDLVYAHGAIWREGCNTCECNDGAGDCTEIACGACAQDADCDEDFVCHFSPDCTTGRCGEPSFTSCDAPINTATVCACNGTTYEANDCNYLIKGVDHAGNCN